MSKSIVATVMVHSPRLGTVLMVEDALRKADSVITVAELKRKLPKQVNHATLKVILEYLEASGKIAVSLKGITWVQNDNPNLRRALSSGRRL